MAKIFDRIDGYAEMSAEDKLKALEAMELEDNSSEIERLKNAVSKANSEAAGWKKKHNELLSEEERKKQEQADEQEQLRNRIAELEKRETVAQYTANLIGQGYDATLAGETALAMADGDTEKVFANMAKANEALVKKTIADKLKDTPRGVGGQAGGGGMTLEKLRKLSDVEYDRFVTEHPEEYKALYSEKNE